MKRKFMIFLSVVVGILIIIGISYAYFTSEFRQSGEGASVTVTTADLGGVSLEVEGTLQFEDLDILPGHKNISAIRVTGFGNNQVVTYNLIWKGTNSLTTPLNFYVYKTITKENPTITCMKTTSGNANYRKYFEECKEEGFENLGKPVASGKINQNTEETTVTLVPNEVIKGTEEGNTVYYYVVLEYPNLESEQNIDIGGTFDGLVTVEQTATSVADIKIAKIFKKIDGQYEETSKAPTKKEGYTLDTESSTCDKNTSITWDNATESIKINNIKEKEITCSFYYMESPSSVVLKSLGLKSKGDVGTITGPSCDDSSENCGDYSTSNMKQVGVYETEDNDGTSYYFRGGVNNNWVKFGATDSGTPVWWRIIRINGDGTIRLIYAGTNTSVPDSTGEGTLVATNQTYSASGAYNDNTYVGFYTGSIGGTEFKNTHSNATPSNAAIKLKEWYIGSGWDEDTYGKYIDENAGFCNDRTKPASQIHGANFTQEGYEKKPTVYGSLHRLAQIGSSDYDPSEQEPTLKCGELDSGKGVDDIAYKRDLFTLQGASKGNEALDVPVGLITADEVIFAGGFAGQNNTGYYLYNNQFFWTMSPRCMYPNGNTFVFIVNVNGSLNNTNVNNATLGVRPVINLKADTTFTTNDNDEKGTIDNPYVVEVQ